MACGEDIFNVLQACVILSWYFYFEGRWVEVWIFAGFQTRVAVPLRLNYPGTFTNHGSGSPAAYLAPPRDDRDLEIRRRTWWMTVVFDRIVSVGGWVHSVDERDIATEFPLRLTDFEAQIGALVCIFVLTVFSLTHVNTRRIHHVILRPCQPQMFSFPIRLTSQTRFFCSSNLSCCLAKSPIIMSVPTYARLSISTNLTLQRSHLSFGCWISL